MDWIRLYWTGMFIGVFRHEPILPGILEANERLLFERFTTMIGRHPTILALILTLFGNVTIAQPPAEPLRLWYRQPAKQWVEAVAVGNGRLGAMVVGGVAQERIQLNEDTLWAGGPYNPANPDALGALPQVRELIFAGRYRDAHNLIGQKMMARPLTQMPYQCVGDLLLPFPDANVVMDYRRDLNLDTAVATVTYTINGVRYTREVFSSPVDQVIVIRLKAGSPGKVCVTYSPTAFVRRRLLASMRISANKRLPRVPAWPPTRSAAAVSYRNGWKIGTCRPQRCITGMSRTCTGCIRAIRFTCARHPTWLRRRARAWRFAATKPRAWASAGV
jgi:hypothetical protein